MNLSFSKGKRKYLFCADSEGGESLYSLFQQAMEKNVPFDFHIVEHESNFFLSLWLGQQKMGTFLYLSGKYAFVNRLKNLAFEAGFSEYEMQVNVCGPIPKKVICCSCYGWNQADDDLDINCQHCGLKLEVSSHYSRRLEAYLGYLSI